MTKFVAAKLNPTGAQRRQGSQSRSKHDLVVASDRLHEAKCRLDEKRADELAAFVRKASAKTRMRDVLELWQEAVASRKRNAPFAIAVAGAAPEMLSKVSPARADRIYNLLGATLASASGVEQKAAADALLNAVLRTRGAVPAEARRVIHQHRNTLQRYPDVWRYIGSFEG